MISVSYHDRVKNLQGGMPAPSPFERDEWFELLTQSGAQPCFVTGHDDGDTICLPLTRQNGRFDALVNWYSFTWRPLGTGPDQLLHGIARNLRSKTHQITFWPVPDEDGSATRLENAFLAAGWKVFREQCDDNHILEISGRSFAEYWAARPGPMRTTLARKAKKVEVEILSEFNTDAWQAYEDVYANSWKPEEGDPALLRNFAMQEGSAGRLRLALASHKGQPVAAQFWTVEAGVAYIHKLAHFEDHKKLSVGATLSAALFEHVIDTDKVDLIDFGTGNDAYKTGWMEAVRPRFRLNCLDPAQAKAWPALLKLGILRVAQGGTQS